MSGAWCVGSAEVSCEFISQRMVDRAKRISLDGHHSTTSLHDDLLMPRRIVFGWGRRIELPLAVRRSERGRCW